MSIDLRGRENRAFSAARKLFAPSTFASIIQVIAALEAFSVCAQRAFLCCSTQQNTRQKSHNCTPPGYYYYNNKIAFELLNALQVKQESLLLLSCAAPLSLLPDIISYIHMQA